MQVTYMQVTHTFEARFDLLCCLPRPGRLSVSGTSGVSVRSLSHLYPREDDLDCNPEKGERPRARELVTVEWDSMILNVSIM